MHFATFCEKYEGDDAKCQKVTLTLRQLTSLPFALSTCTCAYCVEDQ